jgi:NTP pyrophosphatase (non-canonical NTP hydrolase)
MPLVECIDANTEYVTTTHMVREFSSVTGQEGKPYMYASLIQEEFDEWRSEYLRETKEPQLKELADLVYVIYGYANSMGYDLDEALKRVHENNLGRCVQPDGSIQRREDGKVMKNKDYPKVYLGDLV